MSNVPFAKGMKLPTKEQIHKAYGIPTHSIPKEFQMYEQLYEPISAPQSEDDWLAQYVESGQTIPQWEKLWKKNYSSALDTIYLIPLGDFGSPFSNLLPQLREYIELFYYGYTVKLLEPMKLIPKQLKNKTSYSIQISKFDSNLQHYEQEEWLYEVNSRRCHPYDKDKLSPSHRQFSVHSILHILNEMKPKNARAFCCITMEDLFDGKTDSFVGGMAAGGDHVGCFSFHRYNPTFRLLNEKESTNNDQTDAACLLLERSCKVLAHEIGHIFQLDHCIWFSCCMNGSGHLKEDFRQPFHLCPIDLYKLSKATKCNIMERNRKLLEFYKRTKLVEQEKWMQQWIDTVESNKSNGEKRGVKRTAAQALIEISSDEEG